MEFPLRKPLRLWCLRIHRYLGFSIAPFLIIFALSTIVLNHGRQLETGEGTQNETIRGIEVPDLEGLSLAQSLISQLDLTGEIDWVREESKTGTISILLSKPAERLEIEVDSKTGNAEVKRRRLSPLDRILYLHKRPGPHVAAIRGNWWFVKFWKFVVDFSVVGIFALTLTGLYLWCRLPGERRSGILFLMTGAIAFKIVILFMLT